MNFHPGIFFLKPQSHLRCSGEGNGEFPSYFPSVKVDGLAESQWPDGFVKSSRCKARKN
jgi:hypothetical protein